MTYRVGTSDREHPLAVPDHTLRSSRRVELKGIAKIAQASWGRKIELTNSDFHTALSLSIRVETFSLYIKGVIGVMILYVLGLGIHLSFHIFTLSPFLIDHLIPSSTMLLVAIMLCEANDGLLSSWASRKDLSAKSLAWKTWWKREFVFWRRHQPCLVRRAKLKAFKSLKPMLPVSLDLHNLSQ